MPSDLFLSCMLTSSRHLSEEGIVELKGSAEKITASDVIRIALNVSWPVISPFTAVSSVWVTELSGFNFFTDVCGLYLS